MAARPRPTAEAATSDRGEVRALAVEYDRVNLGCGRDHRDEYLDVDAVADCNPDAVVDLDETPWPFPDASFEHILASHVFEHLQDVDAAMRESARVLEPGGTLDVRMPIGLDFRADHDHNPRSEWTWRTPEFYTGERHWDLDLGLAIIDRSVELWAQKPGVWRNLQQAKLDWLMSRYGAGRWCFDQECVSGEFAVVFKVL